MGNKNLLVFFLLFLSCNNSQTNDNLCSLENTATGNFVILKNFKTIKINKIIIQDLSPSKYIHECKNFELEDNGNDELRLKIDTDVSSLLQKGSMIIINDDLKYKISNVKTDIVQRSTMWGEKKFCELKEYKINDSLVSNSQYIIIYK